VARRPALRRLRFPRRRLAQVQHSGVDGWVRSGHHGFLEGCTRNHPRRCTGHHVRLVPQLLAAPRGHQQRRLVQLHDRLRRAGGWPWPDRGCIRRTGRCWRVDVEHGLPVGWHDQYRIPCSPSWAYCSSWPGRTPATSGSTTSCCRCWARPGSRRRVLPRSLRRLRSLPILESNPHSGTLHRLPQACCTGPTRLPGPERPVARVRPACVHEAGVRRSSRQPRPRSARGSTLAHPEHSESAGRRHVPGTLSPGRDGNQTVCMLSSAATPPPTATAAA